MRRVGLYQAKTHLSQICEETARTREACLISKNGKPLVKIVPYEDASSSESVWDTVEESRARYGPLEDFEMPERRYRNNASKDCLED